MQSLTSRINPLLACASIAACLATSAAQADELHVAAANASTNKLYELNFAPPPAPSSATALLATPIPANGGSSVRSLAYISNEQTKKVDLLAADTTGGRIVRYAASGGLAVQVWAWPVSGPRGTDGLSVDPQGNVYVISSDPARNELWVLRRDPALPPGAGLLPPRLVDNANFATTSKTRLLETVVVRAAIPNGPGTGDLLLLINDGRVLWYTAASLQSFLAGPGPITPPVTLVRAAQSPTAQKPTGMALWPTDGSLLVATIGGSVLRYTLTTTASTSMPAFATGLGVSLGKIKTFVSSGAPYAVVDQPQTGKILEFGAAGGNTPATIMDVSNPVGLAATDSSAPTQDCVFTSGNPDHTCTLLGGAEKLGVSQAAPNATILDVSCTIDTDPRFNSTLGTCGNLSLPVEQVCPGFGPTVIPPYLCGGSGPSGSGFMLIKSLEQNGFPTAPPDLLVKVELSADAFLGPGNPPCPQLAMSWAPLTGEGTIPEGNDMIELTSYCGSTRALPPGHSLMGVGLELDPGFSADPTKLLTLANQKLGNLTATVNGANITGDVNDSNTPKGALATCVTQIGTYLNNNNGNLTDPSARYACAAHQAWTCDNSVNVATFGPNVDQLSSYSAIRGRLANLILTINTRLNGKPASTTWPLADPGQPADPCDPDTTPPSAPVMLPATSALSSVTLHWQPSTDNSGGTGIGGYILTRTGPTAAPPVTLGPCDPCSYIDSGLHVETTYSYQLVAFDKSTLNNGGPNVSTATTSTAATLSDQAAPSTPGSLTLGTVTTTSVAFSWTASIDPSPGTGIGGYYIYRNGVLITTVTSGTSFTDTGLSPGTLYSYQVVAFDLSTSNNNGPNVSGPATLAVTTVILDTQPPTTPTGLKGNYRTNKTLTLSWNASTDPGPNATGVGGYYVYMNGSQVGSTTTTSFPITLATNTSDNHFSYQVAAYDKATPTPNVSAKSSPPLIVACYDPDQDHNCDPYPSH